MSFARGNMHRRLEDLEDRMQLASPDPEVQAQEERFRKCAAILDEYGALRSSCAVYYRAGKRIEPENIPRRILGPGYTYGQLVRLSIERASEAGAFEADEVDEFEGLFRTHYFSDEWDELAEWERGEGIGYGTL